MTRPEKQLLGLLPVVTRRVAFFPLWVNGVALACCKKNDGIGMNGFPPVNDSRSTSTRRRLRLVALIVAVIGVLALAAAAFVLSYPGARDTALTAGVTKELARIYPGLFDAVLVIACAGALSLRGALRAYAWLAILVITAAIAAADATHAMAVTLPKRPMEATVAVVPWAVLLIGFTLLYAIARQARPTRTPSPATTAAPLSAAALSAAAPSAAAPSATPLSAPPAAPGNGVPPGKTVPLNDLLKAKPGQEHLSTATIPAPSRTGPAPTSPATATPAKPVPAETAPAKPTPADASTTKAGPATPKAVQRRQPRPRPGQPRRPSPRRSGARRHEPRPPQQPKRPRWQPLPLPQPPAPPPPPRPSPPTPPR